MPRLFFKLLCLMAALSLSGVHLGVAQTVAWAAMLAERSEKATLAEALNETFDGEHPCEMCLAVQHETQKEQQDPVQKVLKESKPITGGLCEWLPLPSAPSLRVLYQLPRGFSVTLPECHHDVATPPPRVG